MKRLITVICIVGIAASGVADASALRKTRPHGMARQSGGIVEKAYKGKVIRVINTVNEPYLSKLDAIVLKIRRSAQLPVELSCGEIPNGLLPFSYAKDAAGYGNTGATVVIIENKSLPIILSSPDEKWAILNLATLKGESDRLETRLSKALWATIARAIGAGSTGDAGCVLAPFSNVKELDSIVASEPSPIAHNALIDVARMSGINVIYFATYRTACQQGWAPAPNNDVQRTIWQEVHTIPDKPMTIEFDPKKDK